MFERLAGIVGAVYVGVGMTALLILFAGSALYGIALIVLALLPS